MLRNRLHDKSCHAAKLKVSGDFGKVRQKNKITRQVSWLMKTRTDGVTDARQKGFGEKLCRLNNKFFRMR